MHTVIYEAGRNVVGVERSYSLKGGIAIRPCFCAVCLQTPSLMH